MKRTVLFIALAMMLIVPVAAEAGDSAVSVTLGYSNPYITEPEFSGIFQATYHAGSFEISIGYEKEVFNHILLLARGAYAIGSVKYEHTPLVTKIPGQGDNYTRTTVKTNGNYSAIHGVLGVCYEFKFAGKFSAYAGLSFDSYSILFSGVSEAEVYNSMTGETTYSRVGQRFSSASPGLGIIANVSYLFNEKLAFCLDFSLNTEGGSIMVGAGAKYRM